MTIVHGQIESLTRIKESLNQKGITRFNSIGDINKFKSNYELKTHKISNQVTHDFNIEVDNLQADKNILHKSYNDLKTKSTKELNNTITKLKNKSDHLVSKNINNLIIKWFNWLQIKILKSKTTKLEKGFDKIIKKQTYNAAKTLNETSKKINEYTLNRAEIISERCAPQLKELAYTMEVIEGLYPLIAGAIGESLVEKELKKLSNNNVLFNDFSIEFQPPIYNRKENDRIFSIQIDHLLVTNSGVFIIETKNWSKKSIESFDLRSPVKQIKRTSHALFTILNSKSNQRVINFNTHHWGEKQLPIRSVVVMIKERPKEKFKYVQVKTLNELNGYISYFDPIFDESEVTSIAEHLKMMNN